MRVELNIPFKGSRNYIQGPDLVHQAWVAVTDAQGISFGGPARFAFSRQVGVRPLLSFGVPGEMFQRPANAFGTFSLTGDSGILSGCFLESDRPVTDRVPYDEGHVIENCDFDTSAGIATLRRPTEFTTLETAVAMTKKLHQAMVPVAGKSWIVVQFQLAGRLCDEDMEGLTIRCLPGLGHRLTKSEMVASSGSLGFLFFSLVDRR